MNPDQAAASFWAAFLRNRNVDAGTAHDGAIPVAGGYALCIIGTFIEYALGAGSARPLREDDCAVVEEFYGARSLPARFQLDEGVLARDAAVLKARGYADDDPVLVVLEAPLGAPPSAGRIAVRATTQRRSWSDLIVRATADTAHAPALVRSTAQVQAAAAHVLVVASLDGQDVGAAALVVRDDFALLSSAAVLPAFRGRGVHQALVGTRLALGHARGATRAALLATPGSPAERSATHFGFARTGVRRHVRRDAA